MDRRMCSVSLIPALLFLTFAAVTGCAKKGAVEVVQRVKTDAKGQVSFHSKAVNADVTVKAVTESGVPLEGVQVRYLVADKHVLVVATDASGEYLPGLFLADRSAFRGGAQGFSIVPQAYAFIEPVTMTLGTLALVSAGYYLVTVYLVPAASGVLSSPQAAQFYDALVDLGGMVTKEVTGGVQQLLSNPVFAGDAKQYVIVDATRPERAAYEVIGSKLQEELDGKLCQMLEDQARKAGLKPEDARWKDACDAAIWVVQFNQAIPEARVIEAIKFVGSTIMSAAEDEGADPHSIGTAVIAGKRPILFTSNRGGDYDVYAVDPDRGDVRQLTSRAGFDGMPSLSPDGRSVAYASDRSGNLEIWTMSLAAGEPRQVTKTKGAFCVSPLWTKDGTAVVYQKFETDAWVTYGFDMPPEERIAVLASRRDLALDDSARRNYPILADQRMLDQLSPDRNCGVFDGAAAGWKGDPHGIWVTKLSSPRSEGTSLQLLAQGLYPSWSHKGDKIAYVYGDDGPFRSGEPGASASLGVLQLRALYWAESPPGRLGRIYYPTWSPTDKYISFRYDGGLKLGVIRLDGLHSGEPCCSTSACIIDVKQGDRVRAKGWQRWRQRIPAWIDEHRLIYDARTDGDWDLYVLDVSTGSETNITNNDQNDFLLRPAWLEGNFLADGKLLSDLDRHGGTLVETHEVRDASPEVRMPTADATRRLPQSCPARAAELRKLTGLDSVGTIHLYAPDKRQIPESGPRGEVEKHRAGAAPPIVPYYKADVKPDPVLIPVAEYPSSARAAGIRGHAVVEALVDADGTVADTRVLKSSGSAILDQAAMDAARRAKFSPAQFQGEPARVWVSIPYMFKP